MTFVTQVLLAAILRALILAYEYNLTNAYIMSFIAFMIYYVIVNVCYRTLEVNMKYMKDLSMSCDSLSMKWPTFTFKLYNLISTGKYSNI